MLHMKQLFSLLLYSVTTAALSANLPCNPDEPLKLRASSVGAYVRADIWKALPQAVDRNALRPFVDKGGVLSIVISKDGGYTGYTNGWHEGGGGGCPVFEANQAWVVYISQEGKKKRLGKEGPFVKVSDKPSIEEPIFHRIFETACFADTRKREWCFDKQGFTLDKQRLNAQLNLDNHESAVPGFEVTVSVAKDRSKDDYFLGFFRTQSGWTVYRLSRAAFDGSPRPVWSPDKMPKPWETLTRVPR